MDVSMMSSPLATSATQDSSDIVQMNRDLSMSMGMDVDVSYDGEGEVDTRCPHIDSVFAIEAARSSMLRKYKSAIAYGASSGGRAAKRRKVCV